MLLSGGVETPGPRRLLEGLGFSSGFFFVILSHAILFTEANVVMPVALLHCSAETLIRRAIRFWIVAWVGNFIGALTIGYLVATVQYYPADIGGASSRDYRRQDGVSRDRWCNGMVASRGVRGAGELACWSGGAVCHHGLERSSISSSQCSWPYRFSMQRASSTAQRTWRSFRWPLAWELGRDGAQRLAGASFRQLLGIFSVAFCSSSGPLLDHLGSKHSNGGSGAQADAR